MRWQHSWVVRYLEMESRIGLEHTKATWLVDSTYLKVVTGGVAFNLEMKLVRHSSLCFLIGIDQTNSNDAHRQGRFEIKGKSCKRELFIVKNVDILSLCSAIMYSYNIRIFLPNPLVNYSCLKTLWKYLLWDNRLFLYRVIFGQKTCSEINICSS